MESFVFFLVGPKKGFFVWKCFCSVLIRRCFFSFFELINSYLGGGFKYSWNFHPDPWGFMIQFDLRIFFKWVGGKNHQLVTLSKLCVFFVLFFFPFRTGPQLMFMRVDP